MKTWKVITRRVAELHLTRTYLVALGACALAAVVLSFVPLLNLVGYESAAFFGVLGGLLATGLTVADARRFDALKGRALDFGRLALRNLALLIAPLLILSLNGLRVPNCDWGAGLSFWALISVMAVLMGTASAWVAVTVLRGRKVSYALAFGLPLLDAAALAYHLATQPPIVGHQWFLGYFGGSIYDEALAVPVSLIVYRALHALAIVAVVAALDARWRWKQGARAGWTATLALGATLAMAVGFAHRQDAGIAIDRDHIIAELGGVIETEHFLIYHPQTRAWQKKAPLLAEDHEYRYDQLKRFFGTDPVAEHGRKVRSFVYADRDSKGALMGGRNTMVAKLWLHEMHILWRGTGDRMLTHELAHIFTEPFGSGPLRLSMQRGVGVNMGLVEGVAFAAEWPARELDAHQASRAMRELGIAPDLGALLGASGFWTQASGRAYTLMGSFVRYLIDTYGIERFKEVYGEGHFEEVYGNDVGALVGEWERFVDALDLSEDQREVARYLYDRPSIFVRVCARTMAEWRRQANEASRDGQPAEAIVLLRRVLDAQPELLWAHLELARALAQMGQMDEALDLLEARQQSPLSPVERAELEALMGDLRWRAGRAKEASQSYASCLEVGVPVDLERSLQMRLRYARREQRRARSYLIDTPGGAMGMYRLMRWDEETPEDPGVAYLIGRRLWQSEEWVEARPWLERAQGSLGVEVLDAEAALMLGQVHYFLGRAQDAQALFEALSHSPLTRYREEARQWLDRLQWKRNSIENGVR
ncbi:tetratricopeptide repeat protein [Lujinxingia vulgaris]|uniref:Tetratricopeptide repeat protein n=1 Tax=Lujinxingia vulgaris TaxID=2600176 RepID=A0A5C6WVC5_9DELT|nr:tetratricopeptide repeat protein [Lujinxingia vulgaris]TXD31672.1 tetratricopeptide repeat protein [Lujinxingia vulgaris]